MAPADSFDYLEKGSLFWVIAFEPDVPECNARQINLWKMLRRDIPNFFDNIDIVVLGMDNFHEQARFYEFIAKSDKSRAMRLLDQIFAGKQTDQKKIDPVAGLAVSRVIPVARLIDSITMGKDFCTAILSVNKFPLFVDGEFFKPGGGHNGPASPELPLKK